MDYLLYFAILQNADYDTSARLASTCRDFMVAHRRVYGRRAGTYCHKCREFDLATTRNFCHKSRCNSCHVCNTRIGKLAGRRVELTDLDFFHCGKCRFVCRRCGSKDLRPRTLYSRKDPRSPGADGTFSPEASLLDSTEVHIISVCCSCRVCGGKEKLQICKYETSGGQVRRILQPEGRRRGSRPHPR